MFTSPSNGYLISSDTLGIGWIRIPWHRRLSALFDYSRLSAFLIIANWAHDFQLTWSIWLILWGTFCAVLAIFQPYNGSPCSSPESSSPEWRFTRLFLIEIYVYPSSVVFLIFFPYFHCLLQNQVANFIQTWHKTRVFKLFVNRINRNLPCSKGRE